MYSSARMPLNRPAELAAFLREQPDVAVYQALLGEHVPGQHDLLVGLKVGLLGPQPVGFQIYWPRVPHGEDFVNEQGFGDGLGGERALGQVRFETVVGVIIANAYGRDPLLRRRSRQRRVNGAALVGVAVDDVRFGWSQRAEGYDHARHLRREVAHPKRARGPVLNVVRGNIREGASRFSRGNSDRPPATRSSTLQLTEEPARSSGRLTRGWW